MGDAAYKMEMIAIGEWPWKSLKVTEVARIWQATYHSPGLSKTFSQCFQGPIYLDNVRHLNDPWQTKYSNPDPKMYVDNTAKR